MRKFADWLFRYDEPDYDNTCIVCGAANAKNTCSRCTAKVCDNDDEAEGCLAKLNGKKYCSWCAEMLEQQAVLEIRE